MKIIALVKCKYVLEIFIFTDISKMAPIDPSSSIKFAKVSVNQVIFSSRENGLLLLSLMLKTSLKYMFSSSSL